MTLVPQSWSEAHGKLERTRGVLRLTFELRHGSTEASETYQSGSLRVRFPRREPKGAFEAALINTAGGLTGGDRLDMRMTLRRGTSSVVSTQACEKIYRASDADAVIAAHLCVESDASVDWMPQSTILFDRSRLRRSINVDMEVSSRLFLLESLVLGRTAMGESMREGCLVDAWRIRRGGRLVYADTMRLNGEIDARYRNRWSLGSNGALATILYVAPDAEARLPEMRMILQKVQTEAAASAWNDVLAVRLAAGDGYAAVKAISLIALEFRRAPMPRLWAL